MDTPKTGEKHMTATALIERDLSRHWVKRLARNMGVPTETARCWIYRRLPDARRKEVALALLAECDRLEDLIADTRRRWEREAHAVDSSMVRREADQDRSKTGRVGRQAGEKSGKVVAVANGTAEHAGIDAPKEGE